MSVRSHDAVLWELMRGALATRALGLVADLRVAEALAEGPRPVHELARELGADPDVLRRLLRALAADGVFAEEERGVFRNTPASEALLSDSRSDFAHLFGSIWHRAAGGLDARPGAPAFEATHGDEFWSWLGAHPEERASFDRAMVNGTERRVGRLAAAGWRGDETVVDVGGGNGATLVELLRHHPGLRGVVFDLPEANRDETALGERIEFVEGSFFERVPAGDVYVLGTILHDWDDERATAILRTIRAAAAPDARLLALEAVVPDGNEPHAAKWLDLLMLALFNGRERDEEQWRALLAAGGWAPVRIADGLVEAVPA
jgi:O-methyltransferase domain/Dimerisation domain